MKNVNLDDPNELWSVLTNDERQGFEAFLQSGQIEEEMTPQWVPWWTLIEEKKLVQEMDESEEPKKYEECCPKILTVPTFKEVSVLTF